MCTKCWASNSPGDGVTGSFELSSMGADIELRSSARTVCILDYWTELSPAPGLNLFHLRFVLSSQIPAHVLMKSSGNFSFLFIDFKLPIFRETLWFIIKLFVVSVVCGAHCLLALFLLCPLWYSGMSRLILVLIFFLVSPVPQCLFRSVLQSPVFVYLLFTSTIWDRCVCRADSASEFPPLHQRRVVRACVPPCLVLHWVLGSDLRGSWLCGRHFTDGVIDPALAWCSLGEVVIFFFHFCLEDSL